ncbi:uncharacterized protein EV420DRAFT_1557130 [Desarmillaria tabescens]|uniref:Uncharacterized protein n=1 Tax=Armillaria tabescens TaxID=1929756 RepID=A0AA39K3P4_ARMTA|nr:uncharacterized protein EV420DRAFT_1557130 [Desarmillaria tabescens]KAK0452865.1 hypothetical protein EV420DRAFT_1557130 [Desarmillaria tabescens]
MFMVHFGMTSSLFILIIFVFRLILPAMIFKRNLDSSVGAIVTISMSRMKRVRRFPPSFAMAIAHGRVVPVRSKRARSVEQRVKGEDTVS